MSFGSRADGLEIPLKLNGVISYFDSRCPSEDELNNSKRIYLTSDIQWKPYASTFASQEEAARQVATAVQEDEEQGPQPELYDVIPPPAAYCDDLELAERFIQAVNVASDDVDGDGMSGHLNEEVYPIGDEARKVMTMSTDEKVGIISKEVLSPSMGHWIGHSSENIESYNPKGCENIPESSHKEVSNSQATPGISNYEEEVLYGHWISWYQVY